MKSWLVASCACFLSIAPASAAETWKVDGQPAIDTAWSKSDGDFGAQLFFTDKPDELFAAWNVATPGVAIKETSEAVRGIPIVGVIVFTGCGANASGNCEVTVRFTIADPDGKPWGAPIEGELWVDKPQPGKGQLELGMGNLGVVIEPRDKLGTYTARAEIMDAVTKKTMVLERTFTAVAAATPSP